MASSNPNYLPETLQLSSYWEDWHFTMLILGGPSTVHSSQR